MATNEDILAAVTQLDPANDEHWTADGQPRLDAVENLLGSDTSRKAVTNAAPEFTRGHAQSLVDDEQDEETAGPTEEVTDTPPAPVTDPDAVENDETAGDDTQSESNDPVANEDDDEVGDDTAAVDGTQNEGDDPLATGPAEQEAEMDNDIQEAEDKVRAIREHLDQGKLALEEAEEDLAAARDAKNQAFPPLSPAEAIQEFQRNELRKRAAARGDGKTVSALDQALTGRRKARPRGIVPGATKE